MLDHRYHQPTDRIQLHADSLWSKWGFRDGDVLEDCLFDEWPDFPKAPGDRMPFDHEVLIAVVRKYLLPVLPEPVEIDLIWTCHNPIRVSGDIYHREPPDVSVEVTVAQVLEVGREIAAEFEAARG